MAPNLVRIYLAPAREVSVTFAGPSGCLADIAAKRRSPPITITAGGMSGEYLLPPLLLLPTTDTYNMKLSSSAVLAVAGGAAVAAAFAPAQFAAKTSTSSSPSIVVMRGYLDDLSDELYAQVPETRPEEETQEATKMAKDQIDRYGPGNWDDFVEFHEFDGGDGQMGVAGDGSKGLEKMDDVPLMGSTMQKSMAKSKMMSAKNAWGSSTGYADELLNKDPKMDVARAQQLENWQNQQEVRRKTQSQQEIAEKFGQANWDEEENWRSLAKFGVERNQDFDFEETLGAVAAGEDVEGTIEIQANLGQQYTTGLKVRNEYMGFADFRAAFTADSNPSFSVEPAEGSLSAKEDTEFTIRFRPQSPGTSEGSLVIETEDFKKTWKVIGST